MIDLKVLFEGDGDDPALVVMAEGSGRPPSAADFAEALESEVPTLGGLAAVEVSRRRDRGRWAGVWLVGRDDQLPLGTASAPGTLAAALLAGGEKGTTLAAPADPARPWVRIRRAGGLPQAVARWRPGVDPAPGADEGPFVVVVPGPWAREAWVSTGLGASWKAPGALGAGAWVRRWASASRTPGALVWVPLPAGSRAEAAAFFGGLAVLAAVNLVLAGAPAQVQAPAAAPVRAPGVPRPSAVVTALDPASQGVTLRRFSAQGGLWTADLEAPRGLGDFQALQARVPSATLARFEAAGSATRLTVEGGQR